MTQSAFIYDAVRTPRGRGKSGGCLNEVKPIALGAAVLNALQQRSQLDTACVDDVIMGCVTTVDEQGTCVAKMATQFAGWHESVPAFQLDRFCGSGLEAVNLAAQKVMSGWQDVVVAGGIESMSRVQMGTNGGAMSQDPELMFRSNFIPQGLSADLIATLDGYSRETLDAVAVRSHQRAAAAQAAGYFNHSIVPVYDSNGLVIANKDETVRPETSLESLAQLRSSFHGIGGLGFDAVALQAYSQLSAIDHQHTAGNSSGIVDGASALLIGNESAERVLGRSPRARIVAAATVSTDPMLMLAGPAPAAKRCLEKANLSASDIDLWEINEAFSSVVLRFMNEMAIDSEVTNVNGGAIAMGHPLGATGGVLIGTVLDELERRNLKRGLVALCVAGGMGMATIIERV